MANSITHWLEFGVSFNFLMPLVFSTVKWMQNYQLHHKTIVLIHFQPKPTNCYTRKCTKCCNEQDLMEFMQVLHLKKKNVVMM